MPEVLTNNLPMNAILPKYFRTPMYLKYISIIIYRLNDYTL